ncbi:MAG: hypothetical protein HY717_23840 [Planctomycetes bacterium]|nr:hypothetical protein [Planctomycetota bacterium]
MLLLEKTHALPVAQQNEQKVKAYFSRLEAKENAIAQQAVVQATEGARQAAYALGMEEFLLDHAWEDNGSRGRNPSSLVYRRGGRKDN